MKRRAFYLIVLILFPSGIYAQQQINPAIDSLLKQVELQSNPLDKINLYLELKKESIDAKHYDNGLSYAEKAFALAEKNNFRTERGKAYNAMGDACFYLKEYTKAFAYYQKALAEFQQINDNRQQIITLRNTGYLYDYGMYNYPKALEYYRKALNIEKKHEDAELRAGLYMRIGNLYKSIENDEKALKNLHYALDIARNNDLKVILVNCLASLGHYYLNKSDFPNTLQYYQQAIDIRRQTGDEAGIGVDLANLAVLYHLQSDYGTALQYHKKSFEIAQKYNDPFLLQLYEKDMGLLIGNVSDSFLTSIGINPKKRFQSVIEYERRALKLGAKTSRKEQRYEILNILSAAYDNIGDTKNAYKYYKEAVSLRDSTVGEEKQNDIIRKDMQYEFDKKEAAAKAEQEKKDIRQRNIRNTSFAALATLLTFSIVAMRQRNKISKEKKISEALRIQSDNLLHNILPAEVAEELKVKGSTEAKQFDEVSVLFTDFIHFTQTAEKLSPHELVQELNECFTAFDNIIERNGLEKIKTIGDAYLAVCGLPVSNPQHAKKTVQAALEIRGFMQERKQKEKTFDIRIGIHSGSVVAGIVGVKKFAYDIWGDTVNTAARMEQSSEAGKINISETTCELLKEEFELEYRGAIETKGKGKMKMYFVK